MKLASTKQLCEEATTGKGKVRKVFTGPGFIEQYIVKSHKEQVILKEAGPFGEKVVIYTKSI
jgi:hypothetical protein